MTDDTQGSSESVAARYPRWLAGLRRAWTVSGALDRWIEDRGVTGVVYTPAGYEADDLGEGLARLVAAGARPDAVLLWDLAVQDCKDAADALRDVYESTDGQDGYVAIWIDPARSNDPDKAVRAAADVIRDVRRANVAIAMVWTPARAAVVERLVAEDCPVALSGVGDAATVASVREKGMARRRDEAAKKDPPADVDEVPVFLLGAAQGNSGLYPVTLLSDRALFTGGSPTGRVPNSPDAEVSAMNIAIDRLAQRAKQPPYDDVYAPVGFARSVLAECTELEEDEVLEDVWSRDHTIWSDDPAEIADRLGWLDVADRMAAELKDISDFARKMRSAVDARHVVLAGMGGSSLGAQTFASVLGAGVPLTVLDTTHPGHIAAVTSSLDLEHAIVVISSKSGTTIETRAHLEYLWSLHPRGDRFVAITDPGSELAKLGAERGFHRVFENPPDIGGRYSALSYFGLVPAALCGIDIEPLVTSARRAMAANGPGVPADGAPGTRLAAGLHEAARKEMRDKLTLVLPGPLSSFGDWIEQLIAESTGKQGTGVLPVVGEPLGGPEVYGDDRFFLAYGLGDDPAPPKLEALEDHSTAQIRMPTTRSLGAEMYRWEMATAVLGYLLDINPFDQPDVEAAKKRAGEALGATGGGRPDAGDARALLDGLGPPNYLALLAFASPNEANRRRLQAARVALRDRYKVAVTAGFGPQYLHSTGQFHKGGPQGGVFLQITDQITDEPTTDIDVPQMGFTFGRLIAAQADGDVLALRDAGRPVARVSLAQLEEIAGVG